MFQRLKREVCNNVDLIDKEDCPGIEPEKLATMTCNCGLPDLVESHDLVGLQRAIEDPNMTCFTYPCHIQPGLNKHMRDYILENQSVVERACVLGHLDMLEVFLLNGCSANLPTSHGRLIHTVLTSLKSNRHLIDNGTALKVIKLLMASDCDVNVKNYKGNSPLMLAAELADEKIMAEILKHCLPWQLSCANKDNHFTPLHMACMNGSVGCVCLLLDKLETENLNMLDSKMNTPLKCSLMVLKNNLMFHSFNPETEKTLLQVQYSNIGIIELLLHKKSICPSKASFSPLSALCILQTAAQIAYEYEIGKKLRFTDVTYRLHAQKFTLSESELNMKLLTPYAELFRMLIFTLNVTPFLLESPLEWKNSFPCIQNLLTEVKEYVIQNNQSREDGPMSLMSQARKAVRLHVARCNKLFLLEQLPVPRKVKDYIRFIDF